MEHATPPIAYRAYADVAGLDPAQEPGLTLLPMLSHTALALAVTQSLDGGWHGAMLTLPEPGSINGVGTIPAASRLLEYGWDREAPPLLHARRLLFRMLAEDNDPHYLFELAAEATQPETRRQGRGVLREAAASVLAKAGYESDPRLRGAARRILERVDAFLDSPLAAKPWIRLGNRHVLAPEAFPPSVYALTMLAHMPLFRSEHYPETERLYEYLSQPKPTQEVVQLCGSEVLPQPHLVLGDLLPNRNAVDADLPFALFWLETMARLGFLKRNDNWLKLFERLVDERDRSGVWHPRKGNEAPTSDSRYVWPTFPLEERLEGEGCWTDVTLRIGVIAKLLGWQIDAV